MPQATDIHDSDTLEQSVEALLAEVPPPPPAEPPIPPAPVAKAALTVSDSKAVPPPLPPPEDDLTQAVEAMLAQGVQTPPQEAPAPTPNKPAAAPTGKQSLKTLDAKLAEAADDLIAGEFAGEEEILAHGSATPGVSIGPEAPDPSPPLGEAPPPPPEAQPAPETQPPQEPAPALPAEPAFVESRRAPSRRTDPAPEPDDGLREAATRLPPSVLKTVIAAAASPLSGIADLLSRPLRNKPQYVRDSVGWFALCNFFLAICVWVYILAIRSPVPPDPEPVTSSHKAPEGEGHSAAADEHGAKKKDEHGGASHGDSHGASAKKPPPKKAKAGAAHDAHASAEH
jgi:hypothetical protein